MHFICEKNDFAAALSVVGKAASAKAAQPILEGIYASATDGELTLAATDTALSIQTSVRADVTEHGAVVFPGKMICDMIRKLPDGPVEVSTNGATVTITYPGSKINLQSLNPDDFPLLPEIDEEHSLVIEQRLFRDMINQVIFSVAMDESRPILTGVLFESDVEELRMVALDGYRLALRKAKLATPCHPMTMVVPGRALNETARLLDDTDEVVELSVKNRHMLIDIGNTRIITRLLDGEFFRYKNTIASEFSTVAQVYSQAFAQCVERANLIAQSKNNQIKLTIEEGHIIISCNGDLGDFREEIPASVEGKPLEIAFNAKYFLDCFRNIDDEFVRLHFNSSITPCVVKSVDGESFLYLILPVRLFN